MRLLESGALGRACGRSGDDRQVAVLTIGGVEMVHATFVGTQDATAQEQARAEAHVVAGGGGDPQPRRERRRRRADVRPGEEQRPARRPGGASRWR